MLACRGLCATRLTRCAAPGRADSLSSALLRSSALAEMRSRAPKHLWSHLVTCGRDGKVALYTVGTAEPPMARLRLAAHAVHPTSAEVAFVSQSQRQSRFSPSPSPGSAARS